jgi:uncharacterized protein (UPF0333 family)
MQKGQVSFEALFITLIVLTSAMFMITLYLQTHDVTVATSIARTDFLSQVNSFDERATIRTVRVISDNNVPGTIEAEITILTNPMSLNESNFDDEKLNETKQKIINSTKFNKVTFMINSS